MQTNNWRLIHSGYHTGPENMAIDEAIMRAHGRGEVPPTLRFYGWSTDLGTRAQHGLHRA